jgi:uncharacterized membrane protein
MPTPLNQFDITFEPADLAGLVWWAIGVLAAMRVVQYVRTGRRPASAAARATLTSAVAVTVTTLAMAGWLRPSRVPHGWVCLIFAALVLPLLLRSYRRTTRPVPTPWRVLLVGLRLAAGLVALAMLARPVIQWNVERRQRACLGIMIDNSRSMGIRDVVPQEHVGKQPSDAEPDRKSEPISRAENVRQMLASSRDSLDRLSRRLDVKWMAFDARSRPVDTPQIASDGTLTALSTCIDTGRELLLQNGARIAGLIVISDGRDTTGTPADAARAGDELAVAGIPLFCVGIGNELPAGDTRSLQARRLDVPDRVSVLNRLDIGAEFLTAGLAGSEITIQLQYDGKPVADKKIVPTQIRELIRADLSHVPKEGGLHQVVVIATAAGLQGRQGEAKLSRYVRVVEDKIQVLYIDRGRYERAAVARALEYARELNVTKLDLNGVAEQPGASPLPQTPDEWRAYRVIVLGDVDRSQLPDAAMRAIAGLVAQDGHGFAMLGGLRTLGSGSYRDTPLAAICPVDLAAAGQVENAVPFELAPAGRAHPCCRLAQPNEPAWKQLPPFAGAGRLGTVATGAEVLIRAASGEPLMVVQERGGGRTAVLAFDSTWQWPFASEAGLEMQRRFWRQLVLWLANRKPEVWVLADHSQYDLLRIRLGDEYVSLKAGVSDPATGGLPVQSTVTGELIGPDGRTRPLDFRPGADGFEVRPALDQPGQYRVRVEGKIAGQSIGRADTAFVVESVDRELAEPLADLDALKRLAARTATIGGEFVTPDRFDPLLEKLRASATEMKTTLVERRYLVDDHPWAWLLIFLILLAAEWSLRRTKGLV